MTRALQEKTRPGYGLFALAAITYSVGVVAFSTWTFREQRTTLFAQVDESMLNATHASQTIIGTSFIKHSVDTEQVDPRAFAEMRSTLDRLAEESRFDLLMAVAVKGTNLWTIIGGVDPGGVIKPSEADFKDPIRSEAVASALHAMAVEEDPADRVFELHHKPYGALRAAVRYEPISWDSGYALVAARSIEHLANQLRMLLFRTVANGLFLHLMAFPLLISFTRARIRSTQELTDLNELLHQDVEARKQRETELQDAIHDLERFNAMAVGREGRIIELKAEVNTLLEQSDRPKRYTVDYTE